MRGGVHLTFIPVAASRQAALIDSADCERANVL
jgi:hypothetical protein